MTMSPAGTAQCTSTGPRTRTSWSCGRGTEWMSCSSVTMAGLWVCGPGRVPQGRLDRCTSGFRGCIGSRPDLPHMPSGLAPGEAWPWILPLSWHFCCCPHPSQRDEAQGHRSIQCIPHPHPQPAASSPQPLSNKRRERSRPSELAQGQRRQWMNTGSLRLALASAWPWTCRFLRACFPTVGGPWPGLSVRARATLGH